MFDGLRERLKRLARPATRYPAPGMPRPEAAAALRATLDAFRAEVPARFAHLFLRGRPLRASRAEAVRLQALEPHGLVGHVGASVWQPHVRVVPFEGRWVVADLLTHAAPDQVFSPMFEQVYFVRHMDVQGGDRVLELGVGSGALSLCAAVTASRVTAVDVSARALDFARFNLALNPATARCDLLLGSLYEPLEEGSRFDVILTNPPFEPVPPGARAYHHSGGGEDGLDVVRLILAGAPARLAPEGRLEIIAWSPGSEAEALLPQLMREALPDRSLDVHVLETWPIREHLGRYRREASYADWCARLARRDLTHLHFLFVHAEPAPSPVVELSRPGREIEECHAACAAWYA